MSNSEPKVGYKSPPVHTRFKPGQSGNPKGRSKKRKVTRDMVIDALHRPVTIIRDGRRVKVSALEAWVQKTVVEALQGDSAASKQLLAMMKTSGLLAEPSVIEGRLSGLIVLPEMATDQDAFYAKYKDQKIDGSEYEHLKYPEGKRTPK